MDGGSNRMRDDIERRGANSEHDHKQVHGQSGRQDHGYGMFAGKFAELSGHHQHRVDDQRQLHPRERDDRQRIVELEHDRRHDLVDHGRHHRDHGSDDGRLDGAA